MIYHTTVMVEEVFNATTETLDLDQPSSTNTESVMVEYKNATISMTAYTTEPAADTTTLIDPLTTNVPKSGDLF